MSVMSYEVEINQQVKEEGPDTRPALYVELCPIFSTELSMDRVDPWVGSCRIGSSQIISQKPWVGLRRVQILMDRVRLDQDFSGSPSVNFKSQILSLVVLSLRYCFAPEN